MKMTISTALSTLNINQPFSTGQLKTSYKKALLSSHPDKGGSTEETQTINAAYNILKNVASITSQDKPIEPEWFAEQNELHPLHTNRLPALSSYDTLIDQMFNIATSKMTEGNIFSTDYIHKEGGVYFKHNHEHYVVGAAYGNFKNFSISNITNGGKRGKTCQQMHFACTTFGPEYGENAKLITNAMQSWFGRETCLASLYLELSKVMRNQESSYKGIDIKYDYISDSTIRTTLSKEGTVFYVTLSEFKSHCTINPFTLKEVYKPLKSVPKKFSVRNLIQAIVNGQLSNCKCDYVHTDDYAMDAALYFREGYIDNPLTIARDWHGVTLTRWRSLYFNSNNNEVSFGKHSNESYSFILNLKNEYPLVDLNEDTQTLEKIKSLEIKAS